MSVPRLCLEPHPMHPEYVCRCEPHPVGTDHVAPTDRWEARELRWTKRPEPPAPTQAPADA